MPAAPQILYEDNHLLAVDKPVGLPTMGVAQGRPSLLEWARQYVKQRYNKPGNVYLGVVSRLDAPVSGVVLMARTSKAASRLSQQFRSHEVEKVYWAIVGGPIPASGQCVDWVLKDERHRRMHVVEAEVPGAQQARLSYRRLKRLPRAALVEVTLETGRKHQIRLQLAHRGFAVLGDRKYGSRVRFNEGIALHARRLAFTHPTRGCRVELVARVPPPWLTFGVERD